jgi:MFS family permease
MTPLAVSEGSLRYRGWRVTLAAAGCVFVSFASLLVFTFGVFLKPVAAEFGWSREAVAAAFGVAALAVAACSPPLGYLLDRYPARRIVMPSMAVFGCAFASLALLTPHLWHLYAVFLVLGVVGNGTAHLAYVRVLSTWFVRRRGLAFALLLTGGAAGAMILPALAQTLIRAAGWRCAFAVLGALALAAGLPLAFRVRERTGAPRRHESTADGASVAEGVRSRAFWIVVAVLFCCSLAQNGAIAHMAALLTDRGIPPGEAALAVSALGLATLVGRLITGALLDRWFALRVAFVLLTLSALGTFVLSTADSLFAGILGAVLIGAGMGGEADVTPYLLSKYFGLRSFATLYGFTWTAYAVAGAIGPVIMGKAFDATGSYSALLARLALLTMGAAALLLLMPAYRTSEEPKGPAIRIEALQSDRAARP